MKASSPAPAPSTASRWMPWVIFLLLVAWTFSALRAPRSKTEFNTTDFGRLPVLLNGRVQPLDSVARNALLVMRGKQSVALPDGQRLSATEWLLELTMKPELADERPVFRVDHPDLRGLLGLPPEGNMHTTMKQLRPKLEEIDKQASRAGNLNAQVRSTFEKAVLKLQYGLSIYERLKNTFRPQSTDDFSAELAAFQKALPAGVAALRAQQEGKDFSKADLDHVVGMLQKYDFISNASYPLVVPPAGPQARRDDWQNVGAALLNMLRNPELPVAVDKYAVMATAYRQNQSAKFNTALAEYRVWLGQSFAKELRKGQSEFLYHQWGPFYQSIVLYVLVFLFGCASWFGGFRLFNRSAFLLLLLGFVVHSAGILFRMYLEGRPPVTNLYSSAVFVGWGAVLLGVILERFFRDSIGLVMASAIGFLTQIVAHNLSLDGDTMEMLRAVLDTNFWLATHVVVITLGYSATYVAGFLAIVYVMRGFFTNGLSGETAESLTRMVYGIVCFATLFSFVGTVLGGIWADQSWGRFWGWDPKENGALIIVLWNAIILHARWSGLVADRGMMNLAIVGNIITSFSWFGVNMLGVGLHSYGFMDKAFYWLLAFILSQLAIIGIGLVPLTSWKSFQPAPAAAATARSKRAKP